MNTSSGSPFDKKTLLAALAELTGTFFLTIAALTVAAPATPYAVGITLLVFVYAIGGLSGSHLNPAVTVGLVASRRFPLVQGAFYIVSEVAGALVARAVAAAGLVASIWAGTIRPAAGLRSLSGSAY